MTAGVLRAAGGGQRLQDRADQGGALRGQVAGQDPGAAERGLQPDGTVLERLPRVIVTGIGAGAVLVLLGQIRCLLNEELLFLIEPGIKAIYFGRRRGRRLLPGSLNGLSHSMISITSVR